MNRVTVRLAFYRWAERWAQWTAQRLPRLVRRWVITEAAVRYREPDMAAGDRYCGPDGITYKDLFNAA